MLSIDKEKNKIEESINNNKEPENYDILLDYFKLTSQIGAKMQYVMEGDTESFLIYQ